MVEDTRGADALPLLAYTLRELNEKYGDDKALAVSEYEKLGGVEGAIGQKLREALSDPQPTRVDQGAVEGERYLRRATPQETVPKRAAILLPVSRGLPLPSLHGCPPAAIQPRSLP